MGTAIRMRQLAQKYPAVFVVITIILIGVAVAMLVRNVAQPTSLEGAYYYNLKTGDLFAGSVHDIAPVAAPDGNGQGARAHVFGCGGCGKDERFVAYITMLPDKAKQALEAGQTGPYDPPTFIGMNMQVAETPEEGGAPAWVALNGEQGRQLTQDAVKRCGGEPAIECHP